MSIRDYAPRLAVPVSARDHAQGPATAAVTLVEYGDYECPHCAIASPIVKAVQKRLANRLRFVFRNFPLRAMHPNSENAAEAAESAAVEHRFWEMHDMLFENQDALDPEHLVAYAVAIGCDSKRVAVELVTHEHATRVQEDFLGGIRSGVNGTPAFFMNGVRYDGPRDVEAMVAAAFEVTE